jgi:acyl carrier protein
MSEKIIRSLQKYITADILHDDEKNIVENEALISSGLIDSFHLVDLALFIEDQFGVILDDTELNAQTFDTLADLAQIIKKRQRG